MALATRGSKPVVESRPPCCATVVAVVVVVVVVVGVDGADDGSTARERGRARTASKLEEAAPSVLRMGRQAPVVGWRREGLACASAAVLVVEDVGGQFVRVVVWLPCWIVGRVGDTTSTYE